MFIAIATAAASLTGLLFVAITVTPRRADGRPHGVIHQVRSAAALLATGHARTLAPPDSTPDPDPEPDPEPQVRSGGQ